MRAFLERCWYAGAWPCFLLRPLSRLFARVVRLRRVLYRRGWLASQRLPVPVIVVGNLTVGGSGKTPLVIWLAQQLLDSGWNPGVVSRGYGGRADAPRAVTPASDPARVGDEPVLIARRLACPVWVGRRRPEAARAMLAAHPAVDVILADDGLQHYALARDLEIVVLDGERRFGNGRLLPAGPLREPLQRLREVDAVVVNGGEAPDLAIPSPVYGMRLEGERVHRLADPHDERTAGAFAGVPVHAVAGIGHPGRFFAHLEAMGLHVVPHPFPDHHPFRPADLPDGTVVMTEKDAVKCAAWAPEDTWALRIDARLDEGLKSRVIDMLRKHHGQQAA